ncbi:cysteine and tyrosine-rich protein 1-like [Dreissena polymorpha]|nr:cysteine and tyrosine-rich protein 1-like [Dreissena polymorpha]
MDLTTRNMWIFIAFVFSFVCETFAGETCSYYSYGVYTTGYCDGYCCSAYGDYCCQNWGWIAGAVIGGIIFVSVLGVVVFMICVKVKAKKQRTVNVATVGSSHAQPYPLNHQGYANNFYKPPQMYNLPPPPAYSQVGSNPLPPPPAYRETATPYPIPPPSGTQTTSFFTPGDAVYQPPPVYS